MSRESTEQAKVTVYNKTSSTISVWAVHSVHSNFSSPDWICALDLQSGASSAPQIINIVSNTNDYWSVNWTTESSLTGTGFFEFELKIADGPVISLDVNAGYIEIEQNKNNHTQDAYLIGFCG